MYTIVDISTDKFSLNGIEYDKVFQSIPRGGTTIALVGVYDSRNVLFDNANFADVTVDGNNYPDIAQLITALRTVVWNPAAGGIPPASAGYGGTALYFLDLTGIDTTQPERRYIADAINRGSATFLVGQYVPFTAGDGQIMAFQSSIQLNTDPVNPRILKRYYRLKAPLVSVGGDTPVNTVNENGVIPDGQEEINPETNADLFIDLGAITSPNTVEDEFNLGQPPNPTARAAWIIDGERYVTCVLDGVDKLYRFIGVFGSYGGDDLGTDPQILEATDLDFLDLTGQPPAPTATQLADLSDTTIHYVDGVPDKSLLMFDLPTGKWIPKHYLQDYANDAYTGDRVGAGTNYNGFEVRRPGNYSVGFKAVNSGVSAGAVAAMVVSTSDTLYLKTASLQMMSDTYFVPTLAAKALRYSTETCAYVVRNPGNKHEFYTTPDFVAFTKHLEIEEGRGLWARIKETADTGTTVDLGFPIGDGNICNMAAANANLQLGVTGKTPGGKAWILGSWASEPTITDLQNSVTAGSFVTGQTYRIEAVGTTDFTAIGAGSNTVGLDFTATGPGTGTGTATLNATKIAGSTFAAATDIYLWIRYNGNRVEYWFAEI